MLRKARCKGMVPASVADLGSRILLLERKEVPYTNETMGTTARTPGVCVLGLNDIDSTVPG